MFQKESMGLEAAVQGAEAVLAAVGPSEPPIAVAVTDENGELVYALRMDLAGPNEVRQAIRKAYTAAFIGRDTSGFHDQLLADGRTVADWADPMVTTLPGGVAIRHRGQVVGAVGVSGGGPARDDGLAAIGLAAAAPWQADPVDNRH